MVFLAACNPYQLKKLKMSNENDVFFVHPSKSNLLTHKVLPIGSRTLSCLFNYGALTPSIEEMYIKAILSNLPIVSKSNVNLKEMLSDCIVSSQNYIKKIVEENMSSVSLRDIKRVKKILNFYGFYLKYRKEAVAFYKNNPNKGNIFFINWVI